MGHYRALSDMAQYDWHGKLVHPVDVSNQFINKATRRWREEEQDLTRAKAYLRLCGWSLEPGRQLFLDGWCRQPDHTRGGRPVIRSLNDLPRDVAFLILEACLKQPEGLELCPVPFEILDVHGAPVYNRLHGNNVRTLETHRQNMRERISPFLGFLRVSKAWNQMGSDTLYGRNQFRFSNNTGWHTLEEFLRGIGQHNVERLRDVVVIHPEFVLMPTNLSLAKQFFHGSPCLDRDRIIAGDWWYWKRDPTCQALDEEVAWSNGDWRAPRRRRYYCQEMWDLGSFPWGPAAKLEQAGKLRHLRFIVPYTEHSPKHSELVHKVVFEQAFEDLRITIVRIHFMGDLGNVREVLDKMGEKGVHGFPGLPACELAAQLNATQPLRFPPLYADITPDVRGRYRLQAFELPTEKDSSEVSRWGVNYHLYRDIADGMGLDVSEWPEPPWSSRAKAPSV